jgi:hypothetical protein
VGDRRLPVYQERAGHPSGDGDRVGEPQSRGLRSGLDDLGMGLGRRLPNCRAEHLAFAITLCHKPEEVGSAGGESFAVHRRPDQILQFLLLPQPAVRLGRPGTEQRADGIAAGRLLDRGQIAVREFFGGHGAPFLG